MDKISVGGWFIHRDWEGGVGEGAQVSPKSGVKVLLRVINQFL